MNAIARRVRRARGSSLACPDIFPAGRSCPRWCCSNSCSKPCRHARACVAAFDSHCEIPASRAAGRIASSCVSNSSDARRRNRARSFKGLRASGDGFRRIFLLLAGRMRHDGGSEPTTRLAQSQGAQHALHGAAHRLAGHDTCARRSCGPLLYPIVAYFLLTSPDRASGVARLPAARARSASPAGATCGGTSSPSRAARSIASSCCRSATRPSTSTSTGRKRCAQQWRARPVACCSSRISAARNRCASSPSTGAACRCRSCSTAITVACSPNYSSELNPELAGSIIDASERGPQLVLKLKEALQAGRMVGIMVDRALATRSHRRQSTSSAAARVCRSARGSWRMRCRFRSSWASASITAATATPRTSSCSPNPCACRARIARPPSSSCAQRYAHRLEHYARTAPYNWFNFYDYWQARARYRS